MNLTDLIDTVVKDTGHSPGNQAYEDDIARKLNAYYLRLMTGQPWEFLERKVDFPVYADIEGTGITWDFFKVTFTATTGLSAEELVGAELTVANSAQGMDGTHILSRHDSGTVAWLDYDTGLFAAADPNATYTITWKTYKLPRDLTTVNDLMSRLDDRGRIPLIDRYTERTLMLNDDDRGTPDVCVLEQPQKQDYAPRPPMEASLQAGGTLEQDTKYRYLYRYYQHGRLTGRSNIVEATTTAANKTVRLDGLEDWTFPENSTQRWVYREDATNQPGIFKLIKKLSGGDTSPGKPQRWDDTGEDVDESEIYQEWGPYRYLRFWPRPDEDTTYTLKYIPKVRRLLHSGDVPEFDESYHEILSHYVSAEIAAKNNDKSLESFHREMHDDLLGKMRNRFVSQNARRWIRTAREDWPRRRHLWLNHAEVS